MDMDNKLLLIIANKEIKEKELLQAIQALGTVTESPKFWTGIANSLDYRERHRCYCVLQLVRRHVLPGMKFSKFAQILDNPIWLKDEDIGVVDIVRGEIPVTWTFEDTVFVLRVFPELVKGRNYAIYLTVSGKIDRNDFIKLLRGKDVNQRVKEAIILEVGFIEPSIIQPSMKNDKRL